MKINEEKFNELSQLDRIEFRQKFEIIERGNSQPFLRFLFLALVLIVGAVIVDIWAILIGGTTSINLVGITILSIALVLMGFILEVGTNFVEAKRISKLEEEFFEIKLKGKKR